MQRFPDAIPELVLLHLWGVSPSGVPSAVARMGAHRLLLRNAQGLRFARLLGTGDGRTFTARDADPLHWGLLTVWDDAHDGERFAAGSRVVRSWRNLATETLVARLSPITARGQWAGDTPFGDPRPRPVAGQVASITRARIATRSWRSFWSAVPPVSHDLHQVDGLQLAVGIGEAPVGLQGTFSVWSSSEALNRFAHQRAPHQEVVRRTATEQWYSEELFARFEVLGIKGTYRGITLDSRHGP